MAGRSAVEDLFDVRGQVALVTGGASGLGYAFSSILADAGATVIVADWNAERLEKAAAGLSAHGRVATATLDVTDAAAVTSLVDEIVAEYGRIDITFANAGIARGRPPLIPDGTIDEFDMADYHALIDVNMHGVVHTVRAAAAHMKRQRSGSIVVTASTAGLRNDPFTPYSYAMAKAAVVNFTKQAAHDLARWNAVIPLGRMGDPAEIRGLALLLASPASSFMTGGIYPIDGGALLQGPSLPVAD